ncbi:hypothetical protein KIPB_009939, partial [Kipferlia bialata]
EAGIGSALDLFELLELSNAMAKETDQLDSNAMAKETDQLDREVQALFLAALLGDETKDCIGVVIRTSEESFDVYCPHYGITAEVMLAEISVGSKVYDEDRMSLCLYGWDIARGIIPAEQMQAHIAHQQATGVLRTNRGAQEDPEDEEGFHGRVVQGTGLGKALAQMKVAETGGYTTDAVGALVNKEIQPFSFINITVKGVRMDSKGRPRIVFVPRVDQPLLKDAPEQQKEELQEDI